MPAIVHDVGFVLGRLAWMRERQIWPNGPRYLWTDAFGVVLLVSLFQETGERRYLEEARALVAEVERVLGRARGLRIGEAADRDGQYFHYLMMWVYALMCIGEVEPDYRRRAIHLVRQVHPAFVLPGVGVIWKMREDLSGPYPGYGVGALDPFHALVVYRLLDPPALSREIAEVERLVEQSHKELTITQDLGLGMMLWFTHFFPEEPWARMQRARSLWVLDQLWVQEAGYFCRAPGATATKFAFTNYGVSIGLQAVQAYPERVAGVHHYFRTYRSMDEYETDAITHVMACAAHFPGRLLMHRSALADEAAGKD